MSVHIENIKYAQLVNSLNRNLLISEQVSYFQEVCNIEQCSELEMITCSLREIPDGDAGSSVE